MNKFSNFTFIQKINSNSFTINGLISDKIQNQNIFVKRLQKSQTITSLDLKITKLGN